MLKNLKNFKKRYIVGIVALLLISTLLVTVALVMYQSNVASTPTKQLTLGAAATAEWTFYVNEVNQAKYMPGVNISGIVQPTFSASDTSTYAFKVVTDSNKVCAVKINLLAPVDALLFSNYDVTVMACNTTEGFTTWASVPLYAAATGTTTATLSGLTPDGAAYIHQDLSNTDYYLVVVHYSYDLLDTNTAISTAFVYTPLPQNSF
jgi:hypothetical protein